MTGPLYLLAAELGGQPELPTGVRAGLRAAGGHGVPIGSYGVLHLAHGPVISPVARAEPYDGAPLSAAVLTVDNPARPWRLFAQMTRTQEDGVEPDLWVVDGMTRALDYRRVAAVARRDGRRRVGSLIRLCGTPADESYVSLAARTDGFTGFVLDRPELSGPRLATAYLAAIDAFRGIAEPIGWPTAQTTSPTSPNPMSVV